MTLVRECKVLNRVYLVYFSLRLKRQTQNFAVREKIATLGLEFELKHK